MLKEDSRVAVWMANEVNAHNTAINSTFGKTAIKKRQLATAPATHQQDPFMIPCQLPTKKATDHAKHDIVT